MFDWKMVASLAMGAASQAAVIGGSYETRDFQAFYTATQMGEELFFNVGLGSETQEISQLNVDIVLVGYSPAGHPEDFLIKVAIGGPLGSQPQPIDFQSEFEYRFPDLWMTSSSYLSSYDYLGEPEEVRLYRNAGNTALSLWPAIGRKVWVEYREFKGPGGLEDFYVWDFFLSGSANLAPEPFTLMFVLLGLPMVFCRRSR